MCRRISLFSFISFFGSAKIRVCCFCLWFVVYGLLFFASRFHYKFRHVNRKINLPVKLIKIASNVKPEEPQTTNNKPQTYNSTPNRSPKYFRSSATDLNNGIPRCLLSASNSRSGSPGIKTCSCPSTVFAERKRCIH